MEKIQLRETTYPSGTTMLMGFRRHRHSHLKSNTLNTLVRILSHYCNDSHCSCTDQIRVSTEEPKQDDCSDVMEKIMEEVSEHSELISHGQIDTKDSLIQKEAISEEFDGIDVQQRDLSETQMAIDKIEVMMGLKEDQESYFQNMMNNGSCEETASKNIGFDQEQILLDELEHLVNGADIFESQNNINSLNARLHENESGNCEVGLPIELVKHGEFQQPIMDKFGSSGESQLRASTNAEDKQNSCMLEEGDIEEGEISDDFCIYDESFKHAVMPDKVGEVQKVNEIINFVAEKSHRPDNEVEAKSISLVQGLVACDDRVLVSDRNMLSEKPGGDNTTVELQIDKSYSNKGSDELEIASIDGQISSWHVLEGKAIRTVAIFADKGSDFGTQQNGGSSPEQREEGKDADIESKGKRGPRSEASKAKRKEKKRRQRAAKNRKLGVKRLKLTPALKPKTINYCRHYLKGRCSEGEKCNFSHDAVPLTKSRPCKFFARNACMKADDCPNDHDLSKYPCIKLETSGYCHRGDACKFSHKIAKNEVPPVASNGCKSASNPPLLQGNLKSKQKFGFSDTGNLHSCESGDSHVVSNGCITALNPPTFQGNVKLKQKVGVSDSGNLPFRGNGDCKISDIAQKSQLPAPKGITFLNVPTSSVNFNRLEQRMSLPQSDSGNSTKNQIGNGPPVAAQTVNEIAPKRLSTAPKGINFLAFGKSQLGSSSSKGSLGSGLYKSSMISSISKSDLAETGVSSLSMDNMKFEDGTEKSVHRTFLHTNEMASKSAVSVEGRNDLGQTTPILESKKVHSSSDDSINISIKHGVDTLDNPQSASLISNRLLFLQGSGRSFECLGSGSSRNKLVSSQKALLSTLAFAAKYEPDSKMK